MNVYISGAITNDHGFREKFKAAEIDIRDAGHTPFNPAAFNADRSEALSYNQCMENCYRLMDYCDAVYQLNDWESSKGALIEYGIAIARGMKIYTADTLPSAYGGDSDAI